VTLDPERVAFKAIGQPFDLDGRRLARLPGTGAVKVIIWSATAVRCEAGRIQSKRDQTDGEAELDEARALGDARVCVDRQISDREGRGGEGDHGDCGHCSRGCGC
jgi:hypothetical protein